LHLCSPQTRERKGVERGEKGEQKNKKIKFAKEKKVATFAVPKRGTLKSRKTGSDFRGLN